ncbi:hypothetical protein NP493_693g00013 [Ridgeia piscesae]|uniref:Uncharacterized protein n=1 Tax=Ridgeia piscesae TaxID=27915 RepID=A0AAD9KR67_RIDPI|nr:hypothetical protein NP493_693g00013 [Ridgeia piscesae]
MVKQSCDFVCNNSHVTLLTWCSRRLMLLMDGASNVVTLLCFMSLSNLVALSVCCSNLLAYKMFVYY